MGSAWEVSSVLATVWSTLDLGTSDPVTVSLIWLLTMLSSNFFFNNLCRLDRENYHLGEGRVGCFNINNLKLHSTCQN